LKSGEIKVLCTNGVKEAVLELVPEFERTSGHKLAIRWGSTVGLVGEIKNGAIADLVILTAEAIEDLVAQGKIVAGSRVDLARSGIGIAVRKGAAKPDIGTADALRSSLLAAKSIAHSRHGASGIYFSTVLQRLGIAEQMKPKTVIPESSPVGEVIARGEAEIGIQQISELLPVAGIEIVGPLPGDLQKVTVFSAGLCTSGTEPAGAKALVTALSAKSNQSVIKRKGLEPV
jgi:molybdate transport system substrate-binding protein